MKMATDVREALAVELSSLGATFSVHTADPGTTGVSEVTGGSYARQTLTWTPGASDGDVAGSELEFDIPASTTATHLSCWNGTTFRWSHPLDSPAAFTTAGKLRVPVTLRVPQGT